MQIATPKHEQKIKTKYLRLYVFTYPGNKGGNKKSATETITKPTTIKIYISSDSEESLIKLFAGIKIVKP